MKPTCRTCRFFGAEYSLCYVPLPPHVLIKNDTSEMAVGFDNATDPNYWCAFHVTAKDEPIA
jgi:hypothetical protein